VRATGFGRIGDLLGLMLVENSKRQIDLDTANEISQAIRSLCFAGSSTSSPLDTNTINAPWFTMHATCLSLASSPPLLVGEFQDSVRDNDSSGVSGGSGSWDRDDRNVDGRMATLSRGRGGSVVDEQVVRSPDQGRWIVSGPKQQDHRRTLNRD
jgi:hypothetical protein